ncbi:MAG: type II 3-dehydroquinate dehydratase [Peptococcaceae bacterium]|jgi:3-dehydroquinate dehydratase-2|nr:type II 3-dehydroquinate dehydratase [Peptococcaceae bacterium]MDH7525359.1 type II 3-dehydroquinate dehydratase [Peptococcaceae bacterium]
MKTVFVIQGPNLNLLGAREENYYGRVSLDELHKDLAKTGGELGLQVDFFQSNHEGELVEIIQKAKNRADYLIINAGAYTHTSIAIRDALLAVGIPALEVHISNIYKRESFRHKSFLADVVQGQICGLGILGYHLAVRAAAHYLKQGGGTA